VICTAKRNGRPSDYTTEQDDAIRGLRSKAEARAYAASIGRTEVAISSRRRRLGVYLRLPEVAPVPAPVTVGPPRLSRISRLARRCVKDYGRAWRDVHAAAARIKAEHTHGAPQ